MTSVARDADLGRIADHDLGALLEQLEQEERKVSRRRSALHNRIDFLRAGGFASASAENDGLDNLLESEQEISARRLDLHRRIGEVRAEINRRRALH